MITKDRRRQRERLRTHIRKRISGSQGRPRLAVFRSLKHVYAQIIDDDSGATLVSVSDVVKDLRGEFQGLKGQVAVAKKVGELAARKALERNIKEVVFDRGGYLYHGAVKAVADGAREAGLKL